MKFPSIRIEGSIISPELFERSDDLIGQRPADFGLPAGAVVKDEIARAWADAQDYWRIFHRKLDALPANASATTETRNLWIVPLLGLLGYQLERHDRGLELHGKLYPISHHAANRSGVPVHIVSVREPAGLDRRPERTSGPRMSAHGLVQEYLNLADQIYGLATNGRILRLLRDSSRLIKLTYLEFDLDRIFTDGLYADFALLYRFLHASRLPSSPESAAESLIERYHLDSIEAGTRIRDGLSFAVEKTLQDLANGFLVHARNDALRATIQSGQLTPAAYYQFILRLIYRLLFLFVIEERDLVYPKDARTQRDLYYRNYSLQRLRGLSKNRYLFDRRHDDGWFATLACFALFEADGVGAKLGISPLAGRLFHSDAIGLLRDCHLDNATLLAAFDDLCSFEHPDTKQHTTVNYGALATEEFGSVYERLLELHPVFLTDSATPRFAFKKAAGNERKTTGSYYTPSSLVECLLNSALEPVVTERLKGKMGEDAAKALLSIRVCDPACGSGHFLIAAGHRLARHLAILRSGAEEPSPEDRRHALREVIGHCLYGVDLNPMSVELCKVTLWLEATEPGKPLSFLDHHIQCGNSLLGATPRALADGVPDDAFKPTIGDDSEVCKEAKKRNKDERKQLALFHGTETTSWEHLGSLPAAMLEVDTMSDDTAAALRKKEMRYTELVRSASYENARFLADAWCAAFVCKKTRDTPYFITNDVLCKIERNAHDCAPWMREEIERLRVRYQFFHWHLAFPEVFRMPEKNEVPTNKHTGWNGGFDVILGNPPWDHVELKEKEWFAERRPEIANAKTGAIRKKLIDALAVEQPALLVAFNEAVRDYSATAHFLAESGTLPLCARGRINLYAVFAESMRQHLDSIGRVGAVIPSGIATDDTTKLFFQEIIESRSLVSLFDFENRAGLFPAVDSRMKFCLLTTGSGLQPLNASAEFVFFAQRVEDLRDSERRFTLSSEEISLLNPNTRTCPIFRSRYDARLTKEIYTRLPVLIREPSPESNSWGIHFRQGLFNMASDSALFRSQQQLEADGWQLIGNVFRKKNNAYLPLYEAKMTAPFDHRAADVVLSETAMVRQGQSDVLDTLAHQNPCRLPQPRFWVTQIDTLNALSYDKVDFLLGFTDVTSPTNERTMLATILPIVGVGHTKPLIFANQDSRLVACLAANLNSFCFDYVARQKLGGIHFTYFILKQLPVLPPTAYAALCMWSGKTAVTLADWILPRVLELSYSAWDMELFAKETGWHGPPFIWDEARRFQLRCELDAAFIHLYGLSNTEAAYILDTFPIVARKDKAIHDTFRTKETILTICDQLAAAQRTGTPFVSPLNPPPGDIRACHPPRETDATNRIAIAGVAQSTAASTRPDAKPAVAKPKKDLPAQPPELELGLDIFGNVTMPTAAAVVRIWGDDVFRIPATPRHGAISEELYTRQWLHALFTLQPNGLTGIQIFNSFRLLLTKDARKLIARSGDKVGPKWSKAFDQTVSLSGCFASLLNRATNQDIQLRTVDGESRLYRTPLWSESPSEWVQADAEITQRALMDKELSDQIIPFIQSSPEVTAFNQALEKALA